MTLKTCTKVNVGLNVLRRRPDGYHDLETLFVPYWGLGDELTVEPAKELSIEILREGGVDWDPMDDLTVRAWKLLKADFPSLPAVSIRLVKGAPVGAGLGGGSA
ncbi:MAG: 4-(cytidine 5'-diphospho)-2-C-methyl-D-erythritol kinase, partial [Bacteroidales bacterium]|nr:4-(cytidine 5'-diphospho)-2-C-methyl-D-erythritol kinase [Bacteroidales bacterium]